VVMNFNDVYAPRKRRREGHKGRTPGVGIGAGTGTVRREER